MPGEYLPPVEVSFRADIADAMAKIEALKAELDSLGPAGQRAATQVNRDMDTLGDTRKATEGQREIRNAMDETAAHSGEVQRSIRNDLDDGVKYADDAGHRMTLNEAENLTSRYEMYREMFDRIEGAQDESDQRQRSRTQEALRGTTDDLRNANARNARERLEADHEEANSLERRSTLFSRFFARITGQDAESIARRVGQEARGGDDAGRAYADNFLNRINNIKIPIIGGRRGANTPIGSVAGGLVTAGPMLAGLAEPLTAGIAGLAPAVIGSTALFGPLVSAMHDVTTAAGTLDTQTTKYNEAASLTATATRAGTIQMELGNDAQAKLIDSLGTANQSWSTMTMSQRVATVQVRENIAQWKALTQSQKDGITALLAEKAALDALDPAQRNAVINYQRMTDTWQNLKKESMPATFTLVAKAEKTLTDAMEPLLPLINATAAGWDKVFTRLDNGVNSSGYRNFINDMAGDAPQSIDAWATSIGNLALGLGKMLDWVVVSGYGDRFNAWLLGATHNFAQWAGSTTGHGSITDFMDRVMANGPSTWDILKNLTHAIGNLLAIFTANYGTLQLLDLFSQWLVDITKNPIGKTAIEFTALALAITRVASALKLVAAAQAGTAAIRALGAGSGVGGALAAARGAGGAAGAAGAAAGSGGAAAGGAAAASAGLAAAGIVAAGVVVGGAIVLYSHNVEKKSNEAAGVVTRAGKPLTAATTVSGVHVSKSFQDLANSIAQGQQHEGTATNTAIHNRGVDTANYAKSFGDSNSALKAVMNLGKTQFGQAAGLFVSEMGGDTLALANEVKKSGGTLDQQVSQSLLNVFNNAALAVPGAQKRLADAWDTAAGKAFASMQNTTKSDYKSLGDAASTFENDITKGRIDNAKGDSAKLMQQMQKFEYDYTTGRIDTTNKDVKRQAKDIAKFYKDQTDGNTGAMEGDIHNLWRDSQKAYSSSAASATKKQVASDELMWSTLNKATKGATSTAEAQAQAALDTAFKAAKSYAKSHHVTIGSGNTSQGGSGITFAQGGEIHGSGGPTQDNIPIWGSAGEFVVNANATKRHLPLLSHLNAGGMAKGGLMSPGSDLGVLGAYDMAAFQIGMKQAAAEAIVAAEEAASGGSAGMYSSAGPKVAYGGVELDTITLRQLKKAFATAGFFGLSQGSFNPGGVGASAGTHDGGGALDVAGVGSMTTSRQVSVVKGLREAGFAAWRRTPAEGFVDHIHAELLGDPLASPAAMAQWPDYFAHKNGLAGHGLDDNPIDVAAGWYGSSAPNAGVGSVNAAGAGNQKGWARSLLTALGAPQNESNLSFVYDWELSEGGPMSNPLNVGIFSSNTSQPNQSIAAGLAATARTIRQSNFAGILGALMGGDGPGAKAALIVSPWAASHYGGGSRFASTPYDSGGVLQPGYTSTYNGTGKPERILTDGQWNSMATLAAGGGAAGSATVPIVVLLDGKPIYESVRRVGFVKQRRNGQSQWNYNRSGSL